VAALRITAQQVAEYPVGGRVVVSDDVVRSEVVERFLGPFAVREVGDQTPGERDIRRLVAERTCRGEVEEARFSLPGTAVEERTQRVA
jgi:hypothetical protein